MWAWVPWVLGLGTVGWIALALLAPGVLNVVTPILRWSAEKLVELGQIFWEGLSDILDSTKTIFAVALLLLVYANYADWRYSRQAQQDHPSRVISITPGVRSACETDYVQYCLGASSAERCMKANWKKLSQACLHAVGKRSSRDRGTPSAIENDSSHFSLPGQEDLR